jgi:Family of unknown function (DUF5678)
MSATITITLPSDLEPLVLERAAASGKGLEDYTLSVLRKDAELPNLRELFADGSNGSSANASLHPNQRWLQSNREDYRGQWVVLYQGNLVAHGDDGEAVTKTARAQGVTEPFLAFIPTEDLPFAGF